MRTLALTCGIIVCCSQAAAAPVPGEPAINEPGRPYSTKSVWDYPHTGEPAIPVVKALFDVFLRDTAVCRGPDGEFFLTGTIGEKSMTANDGIPLWRSKDLVHWESLGLVWTIERDGTWQKKWTEKAGVRRRAVWAPEIHYLRGNFFISYCITGLGTGLLRSSTGRPEGPYASVNTPDAPLTSGIDASLFQDGDGSVYFLYGSGYLARMKDDMTGLAEKPERLRCDPADRAPEHHHPARPCLADQFDHVGYEGVSLFKRDGRYYLNCAERYYERYHCMTAESATLRGPYSARYVSVPYGGHNNFFQDGQGRWWSTMFGNDPQAPIQKRPGILRVDFDADGHVRPVVEGEAWEPRK